MARRGLPLTLAQMKIYKENISAKTYFIDWNHVVAIQEICINDDKETWVLMDTGKELKIDISASDALNRLTLVLRAAHNNSVLRHDK